QGLTGAPLFTLSIPTPPGPASIPYSFTNVPLGTYFIDAFRDTTGGGVYFPAFQAHTAAGVQVDVTTAAASQNNVEMAPMVDPGGAGSLNVFTGSFAAAGGARFDGGSSDLAFGLAIDTFSAGGPFVYVDGVATEQSGAQVMIVR